MSTSLKTIFSVLLCVCLLIGAASFAETPSEASVALSATATVSGDTVTATFTFPEATFATVSVDVTYNTAHLKMSAEGTHAAPSGLMAALTPMAQANTNGKCTFGVVGMNDVSYKGASFTLVFHVEDANVTQTTLTATVTKCKSANQSDFTLGGASKTVTLKTVTPPPPPPVSTNTGSGGSSDTSDTPSSSTKPISSSTKKSDKVSSSITSDTGTTDVSSATGSTLPATDSNVTDSATGFPFSSSGTGMEGPTTDVSDDPISTGIVPPAGNNNNNTPPVEINSGFSAGLIMGVSLGVAVALCGVFVTLGLLRHKKTVEKTEE